MSKPHIRYNTGPIRARQSSSLLGETVFTSLAEALDDRPGEHPLTYLSTPLPTSSSEAITIETENPTVNVVDLTTPNSFPLRHSTPDSSRTEFGNGGLTEAGCTTVSDTRKIPRKNTRRIRSEPDKFESDIQSCQLLDTREFNLFLSN